MRTFIITLVLCLGVVARPSSAQEVEGKLPSIVTMTVEDRDGENGERTWQLQVVLDADIGPQEIKPLAQLCAQLLGMDPEDLSGGRVKGKNITFYPSEYEVMVPYKTEEGTQFVTDFRTVRHPGLEHLRFKGAGYNAPAIVRFREGAKLAQKLETLLAITRLIEGGEESHNLRLMKADDGTYSIER